MATTKPALSLSHRMATSGQVVYTNGAATDSTKNGSAVGNGYSAPAPENTSKRQKTKPKDDLTHTFLTEPPDDDGNAKCAYAMFGDKFLYCEALGWLTWAGTHWQPDPAEAAIDRAVLHLLKTRRLAAVHGDKEAIVKATNGSAHHMHDCKRLFRTLITVEVDEFDNSPDVLNVANGVLDLRTGELTPHSPEQRFTHCASVEYDPGADDTDWVNWLVDAVGAAQANWLQIAIGYTLTGYTREEVLFYLFGPPRAGKGIFTETILAMLGKPLAAEINFGTFTAQRTGDSQNFDLAPLKACRMVAAAESNSYERFNEAKLKSLTGGNEIYCAFKHRNHFNYRPQFKIWLSSNEPINADPDDEAVWGRIRTIEFPHSHLGKEDKTLKRRMRSAEMLRGVLAWAVIGAQLWYKLEAAGLPELESSKTLKKHHREGLDAVGMWLDECASIAETEKGYFTSAADLHSSYKTWCERNGQTPKLMKGLTQSLTRKGLVAARDRDRVDGKQKRGFTGVKLL